MLFSLQFAVPVPGVEHHVPQQVQFSSVGVQSHLPLIFKGWDPVIKLRSYHYFGHCHQ
jgi:hypothetical protein